MSYSLPPHGLYSPWNSPGQNTGMGSHSLFPSPGNLPKPGIEPRSPTWQADSLPAKPPVKPVTIKWSEVAQSCLTLCNLMDCSLPGSSIPGILQAGILEWVTISFSNYYKAPRQIPQVGARHFEDLSPLYLSLPGKAIELFFSTSPKTLSPSFDSALLHSGRVFGSTMTQAGLPWWRRG